MHRPTWGWTSHHTFVALLVGCVLTAVTSGLMESQPVALWVAAAAGLCVLVSLSLDAYGGIVVALACASGLVAVRRLTGHWTAEQFPTALLESAALLLLGGLAGATGRMLRSGSPRPAEGWSTTEPVYGSLGLLGAEAARVRLDEEVQRANRHDRPLTVVVFDAHLRTTDLPEQGRAAALRAVARIVESRVGDIGVPFALTASRVGWLLPELPVARAWETVGATLEAVSAARFAFGTERQQRSVRDAVDVHVGITTLGPGRSDSEGLLEAAIAAAHQPADGAGAS